MGSLLILLQDTTGPGETTGPGVTTQQGPPPLSLAQFGIVAFLLAVVVLIVVLTIRIGVGERTLPQGHRSWLDYGNFYIVVLGIAAVVIGFLVSLLFLDRFADGTQALGFLTALFGAVAGLVGTYFGVKASGDARKGAEELALDATSNTTSPTVTIEPPTANQGVSNDHEVTATVTSADGSPAPDVPVVFTVTAGPDADTTQTISTDAFGRAFFTVTNNGTPGTDTIEATALGGKGTATVTFT